MPGKHTLVLALLALSILVPRLLSLGVFATSALLLFLASISTSYSILRQRLQEPVWIMLLGGLVATSLLYLFPYTVSLFLGLATQVAIVLIVAPWIRAETQYGVEWLILVYVFLAMLSIVFLGGPATIWLLVSPWAETLLIRLLILGNTALGLADVLLYSLIYVLVYDLPLVMALYSVLALLARLLSYRYLGRYIGARGTAIDSGLRFLSLMVAGSWSPA